MIEGLRFRKKSLHDVQANGFLSFVNHSTESLDSHTGFDWNHLWL